MTAETTTPRTTTHRRLTIAQPGTVRPLARGSRTAIRRIGAALASLIDSSQLGPGADVAISRHTGGRI